MTSHRYTEEVATVQDDVARAVLDDSTSGTWCREVVEVSPDGVLVTDDSGVIAFANPRLAAMSGYQREELVGSSVEVLVPEDVRGRHAELHQAYREAPRSRLMGEGSDLRLRRRDGTIIVVEIGLAPMEIGGRAMTVALVRDISPRRAMETERAWLLDMLDLVPDAVIMSGAESMSIEYANQYAADLVGYPRSELVGWPVMRLRPDLDLLTRGQLLDRLAAAPASSEIVDFLVHNSSGEAVPVEMHQRVVTDDAGVRHILGIGRDLRPRLEQEERLRASEESFRTAFEQAPVGVAVLRVTAEGAREVVRANQVMARMFGEPVAALVGSDMADYTVAEDAAMAGRTAARLAAGTTRQVTRTKCYRRRDGSRFWADAHATRLTLPDVPGVLVLMHLVDVTDRHRQEEHQEREARLSRHVAEVATAVLSDEPESDVLTRIVTGAADLLGGDAAALVLGDLTTGRLRIEAAVGDLLLRWRHEEVQLEGAPSLVRLLATEAVTLSEPPPQTPEPLASTIGPLAVAWFGHEDGSPSGFLVVAHEPGGDDFTDVDARRLGRLSTQTQLAVHLARARTDQQRLAVLEERQRIARDLHDSVIQDVIAVGMEIAAEVDRSDDPERQDRDLEKVAQLEEAVRQLRRAVFELRARPPEIQLGSAVQRVIAEATRLLGFAPSLTLSGPVDSLPRRLAEDILGVLREALSNVVRHAGASRTDVAVRAEDGWVTVLVEDDGKGMADRVTRGYGILNMEHRAESWGGTAAVAPGPRGGTRLEWRCPAPPGGGPGPA